MRKNERAEEGVEWIRERERESEREERVGGAFERKCRDFWQIYVCETKASLVAKQPPLKTLTIFFPPLPDILLRADLQKVVQGGGLKEEEEGEGGTKVGQLLQKKKVALHQILHRMDKLSLKMNSSSFIHSFIHRLPGFSFPGIFGCTIIRLYCLSEMNS